MTKYFKSPWVGYLFIMLAVIALTLRLWRISANEFIFYDEGMYLGQNRALLNLIETHPAKSVGEFFTIMGVLVKSALSTAKAFWFFLLNLRVFIVGTDAWYVARLVSAISGLLTIGLVYFFARRYFSNTRIAFLSAAILAVLPSHVFYSRLGMQESFSTLLFLGGIYCYVFAKGLSWRPFCAAVLLALTFFCNYRMIIAPIFILVIEIYGCILLKQRFDLKKFLATLLTFVFIVWFVGSLYDGANRDITFGWMGHQAHDATGKFDIFKFFAFPLNTFILEGVLIGIFLWYALWQARLKRYERLLPFVLVLTQMAIFSIAADQGARYLCVILPFFAISCAQAMDALLLSTNAIKVKCVVILMLLSFLSMMVQSYYLAINRTQYAQAVHVIKSVDPSAKMISTQPLVTQLFVSNLQDIKDCPKDVTALVQLVKQGYFYLILDPQAYISWSQNDVKFSKTLLPFLEDIRSTGAVMTLQHFNVPVLIRFVLDHNEHLFDSIPFIFNHLSGGQIEIYDLRQALAKLSAL